MHRPAACRETSAHAAMPREPSAVRCLRRGRPTPTRAFETLRRYIWRLSPMRKCAEHDAGHCIGNALRSLNWWRSSGQLGQPTALVANPIAIWKPPNSAGHCCSLASAHHAGNWRLRHDGRAQRSRAGVHMPWQGEGPTGAARRGRPHVPRAFAAAGRAGFAVEARCTWLCMQRRGQRRTTGPDRRRRRQSVNSLQSLLACSLDPLPAYCQRNYSAR